MSENRCPDCGSGRIQKSSALYEQGVRTSEGRSSETFITSRGTVGVGSSQNASRSSSLAAERNAPANGAPPRALIAGIGGLVVALIIGQLADSLLLTLFLALVAFGASIYLTAPNDAEAAAERRWLDQWYCKVCGNIFSLGDHDTGAQSAKKTSYESKAENFISSVTNSQPRSREAYISRVLNPIQRARAASERDLAGLEHIRSGANAAGAFDPEALNLDLGIASRLASLGMIQYDQSNSRFLICDGSRT